MVYIKNSCYIPYEDYEALEKELAAVKSQLQQSKNEKYTHYLLQQVAQKDEEINKSKKLIFRLESSRKHLSNQLDAKSYALKIEKAKTSKSMSDAHSILKNMNFNQDQIKKVLLNYKTMSQWSNVTLVDAMKLRFSCNTRGYSDLLKRGFPFPSIRTLNEKIENLEWEPGKLSKDIVHFLSIKVSTFTEDIYKDCVLTLDEMTIRETHNQIDPATKKIIGRNTIGDKTQCK